jgi:TonB-dependent Receptor Plug Domain
MHLARKIFRGSAVAHFALSAMTAVAAPSTDLSPTQPDSTGDVSSTTLAPVEVSGHYDTGVGTSDAASEGSILGELLQDIPLLRPAEVLEAIPGLVVTQHSGDGKANQYFLRGYNLDHGTDFATSVDGVPVNMPTNAHGQGYSDLNFLIPELVDQIDYRKGPYFAQNGDFSSAGSADIHYRDSLENAIADFTVGSFDYRRVLLADSFPVSLPAQESAEASTASKGPTLLAALDVMEENGPWKLPEDMHKFDGLLRLSDGDKTRGWSIDGVGYDARWNSTDQVPLQLLQTGALCRYCALDPTDGGESARDILSGEWHIHDSSGYMKVSAYLEHYRLQLFSDFTYYELRPDTGDQFEQEEARNIAGAELVKGWTHDLFGHESETETGLQVRHDDIHVGLFNTQARTAFQTVNDNQVASQKPVSMFRIRPFGTIGCAASSVRAQTTFTWM